MYELSEGCLVLCCADVQRQCRGGAASYALFISPTPADNPYSQSGGVHQALYRACVSRTVSFTYTSVPVTIEFINCTELFEEIIYYIITQVGPRCK